MTTYWKINNAEGKTWIIPTKNTKVALQLYQPSGRNGKILKALLPFFAPFTSLWSPFPLMKEVEPGLTDFLSSFFPNKDLTFSFFLGTPCVHKKSTIQVSEKDNILAYCKTSNNPAVTELFNREQQYLDWLAGVGVKHVPTCLYNANISGYDQQVFIMSTEKNNDSVNIHEWSTLHDNFLSELVKRTATECSFEESDYCKLLVALKERIKDLPDCVNRETINKSISEIFAKFEKQKLNMVAMHTDFTPWNMFLQHDHLFVFDWEYALRTSPVNLDRYHFFSQQSFFEKHLTAAQVIEHINNNNENWVNKDEFKMYIILIISIFVTRENGKCQSTELFQYWNDLLAGI